MPFGNLWTSCRQVRRALRKAGGGDNTGDGIFPEITLVQGTLEAKTSGRSLFTYCPLVSLIEKSSGPHVRLTVKAQHNSREATRNAQIWVSKSYAWGIVEIGSASGVQTIISVDSVLSTWQVTISTEKSA